MAAHAIALAVALIAGTQAATVRGITTVQHTRHRHHRHRSWVVKYGGSINASSNDSANAALNTSAAAKQLPLHPAAHVSLAAESVSDQPTAFSQLAAPEGDVAIAEVSKKPEEPETAEVSKKSEKPTAEDSKKAEDSEGEKSDSDNDSDDDDDGDEEDDAEESTAEEKAAREKKEAAVAKLTKAQKKVDKIKSELKAVKVKQDVVANETEEVEDVAGFKKELDGRVGKVANETQTRALASFLGGMWLEMRKFKAPFLKEHLKEEANELKAKQVTLDQALEAAKSDLAQLKARNSTEDEKVETEKVKEKTATRKNTTAKPDRWSRPAGSGGSRAQPLVVSVASALALAVCRSSA